jgi:HEAT repeat protein
VGQLRENRRHNAKVIRRLLTGRGRGPDVEKLQRAGDVEGLVDLLGHEAGDLVGDLRIRTAAEEALHDLGATAVPALVSALEHEAPGADRVAALLARAGPRGLSGLVDALRDRGRTDTGPALWAFDAATTIEHAGRDPALAALIRAMVDEREPIRRWAGGLLGAEPSTVDARDRLVRALEDGSEAISTYAAFALASFGDEHATEYLLGLTGDPTQLNEAVRSLIDLMDPRELVRTFEARRDVPALCAILEVVPRLDEADPHRGRYESVGSLAVQALRGLGDLRAVDRLIEVIEEGGSPVRFTPTTQLLAVEALGALGDRSAVKPLRTLFRSWGVLEPQVMSALEQIGGPEAAAVLADWLPDDSAYSRARAVRALHTIARRDGAEYVAEALPRLVVLLHDPSAFDLVGTSHLDDYGQEELLRESEEETWGLLRELLVTLGHEEG